MKEFFKSMYQKTNFTKRLIAVIAAVITMGFALSFLVLIDMGTDPCTCMNLAISARLGMSIGNWQALLNVILFFIVILFGCNNLGFGTLANMFLVGYSLDFFSWLWRMLLPADLFTSMTVRILVLIPALVVFVIAAAIYMNVDMGTAPYDAIPVIVFTKLKEKVPFRFVRMAFDFTVIFIGFCFGASVGVVTILMAFLLGPVISFVGGKLERILKL